MILPLPSERNGFFSISCLIAYFVVYPETLGDYKSVGCWVGRKEVGCFCF